MIRQLFGLWINIERMVYGGNGEYRMMRVRLMKNPLEESMKKTMMKMKRKVTAKMMRTMMMKLRMKSQRRKMKKMMRKKAERSVWEAKEKWHRPEEPFQVV